VPTRSSRIRRAPALSGEDISGCKARTRGQVESPNLVRTMTQPRPLGLGLICLCYKQQARARTARGQRIGVPSVEFHRSQRCVIDQVDVRQGQSLVMTPQLLQAIKLLQLVESRARRFVEEDSSAIPSSNAPKTGSDRRTCGASRERRGGGRRAGLDVARHSRRPRHARTRSRHELENAFESDRPPSERQTCRARTVGDACPAPPHGSGDRRIPQSRSLCGSFLSPSTTFWKATRDRDSPTDGPAHRPHDHRLMYRIFDRRLANSPNVWGSASQRAERVLTTTRIRADGRGGA